jgi:hypothetical protein
MKVEKMTKIIMTSVIWMPLSLIIEAQNKTYHIEEDLISIRIEMQLPCNYHKDKFNYDEGVFISYTYSDSSCITVFEGSMVRLPLLNIKDGFILERSDTVQNRISYHGNINEKYWREDAYKNVRIYYKNVHLDNKYIFDEILDSLNILIISNSL